MSHLLHLNASARSTSHSARIAQAFADAWRTATPDHAYTYRDLTDSAIPPIREAWTTICDTMLREGITEIARHPEAVRTPAEREAWGIIEPLLAELVAADVVLIGSPMYNFGVPAALKAWIDQVTFPEMNLAPRRFVIAYARGGSYLPGAPREPYEYQVRYLRDFFAGHYAIPAGDVHVVGAELTNALVDPALGPRRADHEASLDLALTAAAELGKAMGA